MFRRILIANRGEIAVRVLRACRLLGISPAVIYSQNDAETLAVRMADVAVPIAAETPRGSYLDIEGIVAAALEIGAEAIHPGYGFLAENAAFAKRCEEAGLVFIGPGPEAIDALGNKNHARNIMTRAGLPVVPGTEEPLSTSDDALREAERIGYPVLIKASGGGGGRGMRLVRSAEEMPGSFAQARSESMAAFGSGDIYLEKYIEHPRHIEIQVLADKHGSVVYLGERECSIQRRFQKMIEEAPSPHLDEATRAKMGQAAVSGCLGAGYVGAGTFEFLVDEQRNFYFLEVNTRLQVEHPVTEMITGRDLVVEQIRIAAGLPLSFKQEEIHLNGWSFECRITCEDPYKNFLPCPGTVLDLRLPAGPGVRVDTHLQPNYEVPNTFDSMVAKLITWGGTREEARRRMLCALDEFRLMGMPTTLPFHRVVFEHPEFVAGRLSTHFLSEHLPRLDPPDNPEARALAALVAALEYENQVAAPVAAGTSPAAPDTSGWKQAGRLTAIGSGGMIRLP